MEALHVFEQLPALFLAELGSKLGPTVALYEVASEMSHSKAGRLPILWHHVPGHLIEKSRGFWREITHTIVIEVIALEIGERALFLGEQKFVQISYTTSV